MIYLQIRRMELPSSEKLTLFILASHLPNVFPSTTTLANETGLSRRTIQTCLNNLREKKIITWENTNGANRYKILIENDSVVQPLHTKKQINKQTKKQIKKEETYSKEFISFWDAYPKVRKSKKSDASRLIERALKNGTTIEKILSDLERYLETVDDPKFTKMHTSWLNSMMDNGRWDEEFYKGKISRSVSAVERLKEHWEKYGNLSDKPWATEQTKKHNSELIEKAFSEASEVELIELVALAPEGVKLPNSESNLVKFQTKPNMRVVSCE